MSIQTKTYLIINILLVVNLIALGTVWGQEMYQDDFNRIDLGEDWIADAEIEIENNELSNSSQEEKWGFLAIYTKIQNATQVAFRWGVHSDSTGRNSAGFALMLDSPTLQANGYLVWKHTTNNKIDVWIIKDGVPTQELGQVEGKLSAPVSGDTMNVIISTDEEGHHFDLYINGEFDGRITDPDKLQGHGDSLYAGVMLRGNLNNNIDDFTIFYELDPVIESLIISDIQEKNITQNSVTVTWFTNKKSKSLIEYGIDKTYGNVLCDTSSVTEHVFELSGLADNSIYHYRILSQDSLGNIAQSGNLSVMTDFHFGSLPEGAIEIYEQNWGYFAYKGKPLVLIGGSDEDNIFNFPGLMVQNFDILGQIGGNYIRCTMSGRNEGNVWPYEQDEQGMFDLDKFNSEYWSRFEKCLYEAASREIIVQIEIWATFEFYLDNWSVNPFNPQNNINYTTENTSIVTEWPYHPSFSTQPFFYSIPAHNNDTILLEFQQRFVKKLLSTSSKFGNVLYCIDNETNAPFEWASYWARFIQKKADKSLLITEMWDAHDLRDDQHKGTYLHPELFAFFDISQNNWQIEQMHYDNIMWIKNILKDNGGKRPLTNTKVYQCLDNESEPLSVDLDRWWQNIFAGCASTRFHRPKCGIGLNEIAQQMIKSARVFLNEFNIFECENHQDLLFYRELNEAYCLATPGDVYALYFPKGGQVDLEIENPKRNMYINWFNPYTATFVKSEKVKNKYHANVMSPDTLQTWLALVNSSQKTGTEIDSSHIGSPQITSTIPGERYVVLDQSEKNSVLFKVFAFDPDNDPLRYFWTHTAHGKTSIVSVTNFYNFVYTDYLDGFHEITAFVSDGKNSKKHIWNITMNTTVQLAQFTAHIVEYKGVQLKWRTKDEMNTVGFNILKSTSQEGGYQKMNPLLIPTNPEKKYQFIDGDVEAGKTYFYILEDVDNNGMINQHEPLYIHVNSPTHFELLQNFPNPFNSTTAIRYHVPKTVRVKLSIFNTKGQKVKVLLDDIKTAGYYTSSWDGRDDYGKRVASGIYFYSIFTNEFTQTRRMLLLQ